MSEKKTDDLASIDNVEIQSLTDDDLDSVAGGLAAATDVYSCSCSCCAAGATNQTADEVAAVRQG